VNQPATVNFSLTIQASTVTVDVSGQAQTLNDADANVATSNTLGAYSSTLTLPRVQQFSLRYSF
jgi:hypothetical protein